MVLCQSCQADVNYGKIHRFLKFESIAASCCKLRRYRQLMASCCPEHLKCLCSVRIAYLMWTREDMYRETFDGFSFKVLANSLSNDIKRLTLPTPCKKMIMEYVHFSGIQLVTLIYVWGEKTKIAYSKGNFLKNMMYKNLVLYSDKLINPRKMAEKILSSRKLTREFAFRLACVNFLENEVNNLWMHVQHYFLDPEVYKKESEEVLLWIYYCLLRMNPTSVLNSPEKHRFFFVYSFVYSTVSGNVAYFDYLENNCRGIAHYNKTGVTGYVVSRSENLNRLDPNQSCIIFCLKLLNVEEKEEVFRLYPKEMVRLYLNWPLSETFVENAEEIWRLIPDEHKSFVFEKIFSYFYGENEDEMFKNHFKRMYCPNGNYSFEHLLEIWGCLWKISTDSHKIPVLGKFVFRSLKKYALRRLFFRKFDTSVLKENLVKLFLSNGKAIFELYKGPNLKESLMSLIAKYLPKDFREICRRYFKETPKIKKKCPEPYPIPILRNAVLHNRGMLLKDIKEMLPSNNV